MASPQKVLVPVGVIAVLFAIAFVILKNPPQANRRPPSTGAAITVEILTLRNSDYPVTLQSYGTVQPRTQSMLVAQVGGQIVSVNPNFREGGYFEKGDVLLEIDPRDYEADVKIAEASLMDARQSLAEAEARSNQARLDWERLGNEGDAPDLVLRRPQLLAAQARVVSATSSLQKASLDLERSRIVAPFAGRVLQQLADVGQVVGNNTQLAEVYSTDVVEIRLPLRNRDLAFIDLPEEGRFGDQSETADKPKVTIASSLGQKERWQGEIVRTEGAIDSVARQLHVVAQINDPFGANAQGEKPLKIGEYVTAELEGRTLRDVIVIPNKTIYQGTYVYTVVEGLLQRKDIEIAWQNDVEAIVASGLGPGEALVTTPLGQVTSGLRVAISGESGSRLADGAPSETGGQNATDNPGQSANSSSTP